MAARVAPMQRPGPGLSGGGVTIKLRLTSYTGGPLTAVPDFGLVANHPALDFCNTVGEWTDGRPRRDKLVTHGHLLAWARAAGLLTAAEAAGLRRPPAPARLLARARGFRSALYELLTAALSGRQPDAGAVSTVEAEVSRAHAARRLEPVRGRYVWRWADPATPDRPLLEVARAAAELLDAPLERVRRCGGDGCGWLFRDTSRGGRRRWCSMSTCGNTAKVRRFRGSDR